MAHILVATAPVASHFYPVASVVRELVDRGHTVWWYTGKAFQSKIERLGATYKPMSAAYDYSGMSRDEAFPQLRGLQGLSALMETIKALFIEQAPLQMQDILSLLSEFPADILMAEEVGFGMGFVREKTGLPVVVIGLSINSFDSKDIAPIGCALPPDRSALGRFRNACLRFLINSIALRSFKTYIDNTRSGVGLPILNRSVLESIVEPPDLYLLGTIPEFEYPRSDLSESTHFVGTFTSPPVETFEPPTWWDDLHGDLSIVLVTQGTLANDDLNELVIPTIRALADENVLVIATTAILPPSQIDLTPLPVNLRLEQFIPFDRLMPDVDVMVTNGGFGGVQLALSNGVPLVVAGATEEKPEIAARVAWGGVGIDLKTGRPSEQQIRAAVRTIRSNPSYRSNAKRLQVEFDRYNGPKMSADLIERSIGDFRRS
ncbi:glycosyltransferase [Chamaesiphon minutus]|uniref:Glycosyl transferase, UDP-glucuronosyltransferase n=1 Tax=Chamaesiphon minutus (strain ATCC 27169 / PCC 6605) TaxID=1173020 RepID=K9UR82_CHAP6|nr:nucleotide disphospho-sugar-binding domain-containing protein [Chamaesiphon minutus]AFY96966.1 glycosyl transferase, UDP-glucuronosyltransferase [Chamaesiphon minutus PCC 6605]